MSEIQVTTEMQQHLDRVVLFEACRPIEWKPTKKGDLVPSRVKCTLCGEEFAKKERSTSQLSEHVSQNCSASIKTFCNTLSLFTLMYFNWKGWLSKSSKFMQLQKRLEVYSNMKEAVMNQKVFGLNPTSSVLPTAGSPKPPSKVGKPHLKIEKKIITKIPPEEFRSMTPKEEKVETKIKSSPKRNSNATDDHQDTSSPSNAEAKPHGTSTRKIKQEPIERTSPVVAHRSRKNKVASRGITSTPTSSQERAPRTPQRMFKQEKRSPFQTPERQYEEEIEPGGSSAD